MIFDVSLFAKEIYAVDHNKGSVKSVEYFQDLMLRLS